MTFKFWAPHLHGLLLKLSEKPQMFVPMFMFIKYATTKKMCACNQIKRTVKTVFSFPFYFLSCVCVLSCVQLFATPWTVTCQALLSMGFPRQECWSGLPFSFFREPSQHRDQTRVSCVCCITTEPPGKLHIR